MARNISHLLQMEECTKLYGHCFKLAIRVPQIVSNDGYFPHGSALHSTGKYFKGRGIGECFGKNTIESVLSGGHYVCSLAGMQVIKEALESMKWEAFWMTCDSDEWLPYKDAVKKLLTFLTPKVVEDVVVAYREVDGMVIKLKGEMDRFHKECKEKSEMCKYVLQGLKLINLIEMLIVAMLDLQNGL